MLEENSEQKIVEEELGSLIKRTLELEDELNNLRKSRIE